MRLAGEGWSQVQAAPGPQHSCRKQWGGLPWARGGRSEGGPERLEAWHSWVEQSLGHRLPRRPPDRVSCCGLAHTDHSTAVSSHVLATILLLIQPRVTVNEVVLGASLSPQDVWEAVGWRHGMGQPLAVEGSGCPSSRRAR